MNYMVYPYEGILFSSEWNTDTCYNLNEPWKHAKWKKSQTKGYMIPFIWNDPNR